MNDVQEFGHLIKDIKFAMLTTIDENKNEMHSRPMTLQQVEFDGDLWFFASKATDLVKQIEARSLVNLAFSDPKNFSFLSAHGFAEIVQDDDKAEELWSPMYKAWFPEGLADPNLCLIKVVVKSVDYWKSPESKLVRLAGFTKSILGGKKGDAALGKHGHFNF